ncbi:MAG: acyltransferase [Gammaproteobacteria bacterium]|nr:acyltransferase [Gammaproteobacteria bacterium]
MASGGNGHIKSLDGIRAVAALMVFIAHAGLEWLVPGGFGVTIFFFLSGFLITTLLHEEYSAHGRIRLGRFYLRRVYRILPPMYIAFALAALLAALAGMLGSVRPMAVLAQLLQLTNYYLIAHGDQQLVPYTGVMWSLSVEEHFYLLYPLLLLLLLPRLDRRRIALLLYGACALVLLWRCVLVMHLHVGSDYSYMATDARIDSLLFGCALALGWNPALEATSRWSERHWALALAAGIALLLASLLNRDPLFRDTLRYTVQGIALLPVFCCAIRFHHWAVFRWLEWPLVRGLGLISYTFYLVHFTALGLAERLLGSAGVLRALLGLAFAVGFSWLMYLLVERRLAELRRRLHG